MARCVGNSSFRPPAVIFSVGDGEFFLFIRAHVECTFTKKVDITIFLLLRRTSKLHFNGPVHNVIVCKNIILSGNRI